MLLNLLISMGLVIAHGSELELPPDCIKQNTIDYCYLQAFKKNKTSKKEQQETALSLRPVGYIRERFHALGMRLEKKMWSVPLTFASAQLVPLEIATVTSEGNKKPATIGIESLYEKRVLSIGEGEVGVVPYLVNYGAKAVALDLDYTAENKKKNLLYHAYKDEFVRGDATKFFDEKLFKDPFDLIISNRLLNELSYADAEKVLIQAVMSLKPMSQARFAFEPTGSMKVTSFEYRRMLSNVRDRCLEAGFRVRIRQQQYLEKNALGNLESKSELLILDRWE